MKSRWMRGILVLAGAIILTGCGPDRRRSPAGEQPVVSTPEAPGTPEHPREIKIEVGESMKFSLNRIEASPGETLRVLLINTGSLPKEAMAHNWVLLRAGVDLTSFANAALGAKATDYIPADRAADVIAHTRLLGGRARDAVIFSAPTETGDYSFLCTFPAHLQLGMKGVLAVK